MNMKNRKRILYFIFSSFIGGMSATDQDRPNIIYIMSDDHASQAVSAYGGILSDILPMRALFCKIVL